jgi:hypothetical protein
MDLFIIQSLALVEAFRAFQVEKQASSFNHRLAKEEPEDFLCFKTIRFRLAAKDTHFHYFDFI